VQGKNIDVTDKAKTVGDLLKEQAISLNEKDSVTPEPSAELSSGLSLKVVRRTERTEIVREEIPYDVEREEDRYMMVGETKEVRVGWPGVKGIQ